MFLEGLFLLHLHFNNIRRGDSSSLLERIPNRKPLPLSHILSPWVLQLNMRCSVWPGWVLIKPDKDLSPVHGSMCCHSVRQ